MPQSQENEKCLNCDQPIAGAYCASCGQSTAIHRITFRETINDFFSSTFALEGPLLRTIKLLIVNPGLLFRSFITGKRKSYYKPVAFFVVITAIYLIIRALLKYDPLEGQMPQIYENSPPQILRMKRAAFYMVANINNVMLFLVFAIAFNQKLFFRKNYNLAEYVIIGFYIAGIYTLMGLIQMLIEVFIGPVPRPAMLLFLVFYIGYCSFSFHQNESIWAIIRYILLGIFSLVLYMIFGFGFSYLMV